MKTAPEHIETVKAQRSGASHVHTDYPPFFASLLEQRDLVDHEEIERFLNPNYERDTHDPHLLKNIDKAADRIWQAVHEGEHVVIFADYDADGISAAAILSSFLRDVGHVPGVYMPDRREEGHGLNSEVIKKFITEGAGLIVTLDCGITNIKEIAYAQGEGVDVVVVDHHQVVEDVPPAYTVVDPHQEGDAYPFKRLCGATLAFKLVQVLAGHPRMSSSVWQEGQEKWYLDLVALATIADMMPMIGENRALVRYGLYVLARTKRPGLRQLFNVAGVEPRFDDADLSTNINEVTVGFALGPRLNAASRMAHAGMAYDLLMAETDRSARALALELEENNEKRKKEITTIERDIAKRLAGELPPFIVEHSEHWSISLLGLVASRLQERFNRPVMLVDSRGTVGKASFRAPEGFDLLAALETVSDHLIQYGGHHAACGCSFEMSALPTIQHGLEEYARKNRNARATRASTDGELAPQDITLENALLVGRLAPFGEANPLPRFELRDVVLTHIELMGKKGNHAKLYFEKDGSTVCALFFFHNGEAEALHAGSVFHITGELSVNEWKGKKSPQFKLTSITHA